MNTFDPSTSEYWMLEAFKSLEKAENDTARLFAEKAIEINNQNIDAHFLLLTSLIKEIDNPSIYQLETNLEKSRNELKFLRNKEDNGELDEKQKIKLKELSKEQYDFLEYANRYI